MRTSRRTAILQLLGLAGCLPLGAARLARAQQVMRSDRRYVFANFKGGWDTLLGLDPRDPEQFGPHNMADTLIQPAFELLPENCRALVTAGDFVFGPYIGGLARHRHLDKLAVVRGMSMETVTHAVGTRRFLTGRPPAGSMARGSSAATWLAARLASAEVMANLAVGVESFNVDQPAFATGVSVASAADLVRALRPGGRNLPEGVRAEIDAMLSSHARCAAAHSPMVDRAEHARLEGAGLSRSGLDQALDLFADTAEMRALRDRHLVTEAGTPEEAGALAAQAIVQGLSRVVSINVTQFIDTHYGEWATVQGPGQQRGFDVVSRLADHLADTPYDARSSWLDHTIIVGFSEFSRTPLLNAFAGRDHHLTNACFLLGGGVRAGVYGRSSDVGYLPTPTVLETGEGDHPAGEIVRPEHVIQALFEEVGIDNGDLRVQRLRVLA